MTPSNHASKLAWNNDSENSTCFSYPAAEFHYKPLNQKYNCLYRLFWLLFFVVCFVLFFVSALAFVYLVLALF